MNGNKKFLEETGLEVAIVGMAGRFPGAKTVSQFWDNLSSGKESIRFFSDEEILAAGVNPEVAKRENYVKARGVLEDVEYFDAGLFSCTPKESESMDPQHRFFLETCWEALEDAGYDSSRYPGSIGVYGGVGFNSYLMLELKAQPDFLSEEKILNALIGNDKEYLSTRVSYKLDLRGPSITVQSACSTSLVAVHLACQGLIAGECDMALAGGVSIRVPEHTGYIHQQGSILSPDGHCRAFDENAKGAVGGNGVGVVVLKRLEDARADGDHVYAVIKGSSINNDGSSKAGFAASSVDGEARAIRSAQAMAEIDPQTISYIETHGSGTAIGDPIEISALNKVFGGLTETTHYCAVGSVKTNVGHLDTAAGITGLIKTSLALSNKKLVPSLNFNKPNPRIDFDDSPFYVNTQTVDWPDHGLSRRAGVSSFGIGGTNAHVILEEAPTMAASGSSRPWQLLSLSARSHQAVGVATENLARHLEGTTQQQLADVAYTLQMGRREFNHRRILLVKDMDDAISTIRSEDPKRLFTAKIASNDRPVSFMFSGQGSQYINMGRELYENEAFFRDTIDRCASLLHSELELDIRDILYPAAGQEQAAAEQLQQTALTQPALFVVEYALARLLMHWGIMPVAMVGHSIGEYVAACIAGVFSVEDALRLVALRGRLMQGLPAGSMLSVGMHEADIEAMLPEQLSLAALNAPASSVVSGPTDAINAFRRRLEEAGVSERVLHTSHAFHSSMMDPILDEFTAAVADIELHAPTIPYISNVTGDWISEQQVRDPAYWSQHLHQAVRFADGVRLLVETSNQTLLEVGPGNTLSALARQTIGPVTGALVLNTMHHPTDSQPAQAYLLNALGRLWASGVKIDWSSYYADEQRRRVSLPTYPFERQRYWVTDGRELKDVSQQPDRAKLLEQQYINVETSVFHPRPELQGSYCGPSNELEWRIVSIWQDLFGIEKVGVYDNFFDLGGDSMLAIQLAARLQEHFEVALQFGEIFESPTVAEQAVRIAEITDAGDAAVTRVSSPIVRIQPKGDRPIFFCVHPAGGIVHCYTELARYLGKDQPFYALQHPGMDGPYEPYIEFDITAEYYVKAMREVQPEGPYYLGGWSFGGTLAFEMAQQLQRQGEQVAFLVMIDSPGPDFINGECRRPAFDDTGIFTFLSKGVSGIFQNKLELNHGEFHQLSEAEKFDYILQNAGDINDAKSLEAGREQLGRVIEMFKVSDYAERQYESSIYHGKITMLRVQNIDDYEYTGYKEHPELSNPTFGWDKLSSHEVDVHFVPGTHMTMVAKPHVQELARTLRRCLDNAFLEQDALQLEQA